MNKHLIISYISTEIQVQWDMRERSFTWARQHVAFECLTGFPKPGAVPPIQNRGRVGAGSNSGACSGATFPSTLAEEGPVRVTSINWGESPTG